MDRRDFLRIVVSIPILGALLLFVSPLFRYLRPTSGPMADTSIDVEGPLWDITQWNGQGGLFSRPDMPERERDVSFSLGQFPRPWTYETFTFSQRSAEYTFRHFQTTNLPGYVVRLPEDQPNGQPNFIVVNRICPHMGCVFNFLPNPAEGAAYNYPRARNPLFACPCHLSVFDPLQFEEVGDEQIRGRVVSGPAPRPPRYFEWRIDGDRLLITEAEAGGIS